MREPLTAWGFKSALARACPYKARLRMYFDFHRQLSLSFAAAIAIREPQTVYLHTKSKIPPLGAEHFSLPTAHFRH